LEFPCNISATAGVSDFKFGAQLGFTKAHHKITRKRKGGHGGGLGQLPKICWLPLNIYTVAETSDFKFIHSLGLPRPIIKSHPKEMWAWPWASGASQNFVILLQYLQWLKLGTSNLIHSLGLPRPTIKPHPEEKWAWPWVREAPIYLGFPFNISATARCPLSVSGASCMSLILMFRTQRFIW